MADHTQHSDSIDLVKLVICVNKLKNLIFLSQIIFPNILNPIYRPVNSLLQYRSELAIPACVSSITSSHFKYTFFKKTAPISPTPNGHTLERLFNAIRRPDINAWEAAHGVFFWIDRSQNIWHWQKYLCCGPQILVPTAVRLLIRSTGPCSPWKFSRNCIDHILRNIHRDKNRRCLIHFQRNT